MTFNVLYTLKVAMVADIGGTSLEDATRRMMSFLMVPELQRQYNVTGRMNKLSFKDMRLFDVFYGKFKFLIAQCNFSVAFPLFIQS